MKENVFGARAQSEQRALDKFHAPLPKYSKGIKFNLNQIKVKVNLLFPFLLIVILNLICIGTKGKGYA